MRALSWSVLAFVIAMALETARAGAPKADFVVDAVAWSKEYVEDQKAFKEKYQGKFVEVTGKVVKPETFPVPTILLEGYKKEGDLLPRWLECTFPKEEGEKHQGLQELSKGQTVRLRGRCGFGTPSLSGCALVKLGPSTARPFTVAGLLKEFNPAAGKKKYQGTDAVIRSQIVEMQVTDAFVRWTLSDPGKKTGPRISAQITTNDKNLRQEYAKTKVGDVIILIGEIDDRSGPTLWDARLLKEPPEGVRLPGYKK